MGNFDTIRNFALEHGGEAREYPVKGKPEPFKCVIRVMAGIDEELAIRSDALKRQKTFEAMKDKDHPDGRLPVQIPLDIFEEFPDRFAGATPIADGQRVQFDITTMDEVSAATALQHALVEPAMEWPEVVVFQRLNGKLAAKILNDFRKLNEDDAQEEAKNE